MRSQRDSFMACTNLEGEETAFSRVVLSRKLEGIVVKGNAVSAANAATSFHPHGESRNEKNYRFYLFKNRIAPLRSAQADFDVHRQVHSRLVQCTQRRAPL